MEIDSSVSFLDIIRLFFLHFSDNGVTYEIVKGGTSRGGDRLIDSLGFTYNLKVGSHSA